MAGFYSNSALFLPDTSEKLLIIISLFIFIPILIQNTYAQQSLCGFDFLEEYNEPPQNGCPDFFGNTLQFDIPVVVHVLYDDDFENISHAQAVDMIAILNTQLPPMQFGIYQVDIDLVLAENGTSCMPGFEKVFIDDPKILAVDLAELSVEEGRIKSTNIWPVDQYLNIWVVESIQMGNDMIGGYAHNPGEMSQYDGIVIDDNNLDDLIHHFGHYAGLYHPWVGEGCIEHNNCSNGDYVDDTSELKENLWFQMFETIECENWISGFYKPSDFYDPHENPICFPDVIGSWEKFQYPADNFMTYQRICWNTFTEGQYARMINEFNTKRLPLITNEGNQVSIDMSENIDHTVAEFLNKAGLSTVSDLCVSDKQFIIELGGNFIIEHAFPVKFANGTVFRMKEDAKISVVNNSRLEFDDVHLYSCEGFWDHIFVEHGSELDIMNNSSIEDAKTGILAQKRNGSDFTSVTIQNCLFNNNRIGILLEEQNVSGATYFELANCTFTSDGSYSYHNGLYSETRPIAGIKVIKQDFVEINQPNTFKRLSNGIVSSNSNLTVENCIFEDIREKSFPYWNGIGIQSSNSLGGSLTSKSNTFTDVQYGLRFVRGELYARGNIMNEVKYIGMDIRNSPYFEVEENSLNVDERGIYVGFSHCEDLCFARFPSIISNVIHVLNELAKGKGIEIVQSERCFVEGNTVVTCNNDAGIYLLDSYDVRLVGNSVYNEYSYRIQTNGIYMGDMEEAWLWGNDLFDAESPTNNMGIYVESSFGNGINCNTMDGFRHGMQFWDNCDRSLIRTNYMYDNTKDMVIGIADATGVTQGASIIGDQRMTNTGSIVMGNINLYPESSDEVHNSGINVIVAMSRFYVNSLGNADFLPEIIESAGIWFDDNEIYQNYSLPCFTLDTSTINPAYKCSDFIMMIQTIDTLSGVDECKKQMWQYQYFKKLLEMKEAMLLTSDCLDFLDIESDNVLLKLAEIELGADKIRGFSNMDTTLSNEIKVLSERLDSLYDVTNPFPEWQLIMDQYSQLWLDYQLSWEDEKNSDVLKTDSLLIKTTDISVTDTCLQVLQDVLKVKLNLLRNDTLSIDDMDLIVEIALSCPTEMGNGVYTARSLLSLFQNNRYPRMEECVAAGISGRNVKREEQPKKLSVFPNPANKDFTVIITLNPKEEGELTILDMQGHEKLHISVTGQDNHIKIESGNWLPGVYVINYIANSGEEQTEKLLITK